MDVKLVVTGGSKPSQVIQLRSEETILGRQRGCDLRIPSAQVSRRHCRLSFRDDCLLVEDLASANGSFLNGEAIQGLQLVRPGDLLKVGPITFRVEYQLTTSAMQRMLAGLPPVQHELVDVVELVEEVEPVKKKKAVAKQEAVNADEATVNFDDLAWEPPSGEDFRDILSELDKE
jgi:pSer/pThr/pTyr-binding forkhead associated (FHA) protein